MFSRGRRHDAARSGTDESGVTFTEAARRALAGAREEAQRLGYGVVGTEHLLLALTRDPDGDAGRLLTALLAPAGADLSAVRAHVEAMAGAETSRTGPHPRRLEDTPFTGRAKKVLERALRETCALGHDPLGTEHFLLGILAERRGLGARVLGEHGVTLEAARAAVRHGGTRDASAFRLVIDDASDRSIYEQIIAQIQEAVATGRLRSGERLPTVRQLADTLDVAPGTVARGYAELERLGLVVSEGTRGTRVAPRPRPVPTGDRPAALVGLLRPVVVAAFHLGATAPEVRAALTAAMTGIFGPSDASEHA